MLTPFSPQELCLGMLCLLDLSACSQVGIFTAYLFRLVPPIS